MTILAHYIGKPGNIRLKYQDPYLIERGVFVYLFPITNASGREFSKLISQHNANAYNNHIVAKLNGIYQDHIKPPSELILKHSQVKLTWNNRYLPCQVYYTNNFIGAVSYIPKFIYVPNIITVKGNLTGKWFVNINGGLLSTRQISNYTVKFNFNGGLEIQHVST